MSATVLPDELTFGGVRPLRGRVRVPGDKSISHRALLFAAIANGRSTLTHLATGEDVGATHAVLTQLGVKIRTGTSGTVVYGGGFGGLTEPGDVLDCGNSGTAMRASSPACSRGARSSRCSPATRRCANARWRALASRCGRWVRGSTVATAALGRRS